MNGAPFAKVSPQVSARGGVSGGEALGDARQAGPTARENAVADAGSAVCRNLGKYARRSAAPSRSGFAGTGGRLFRHPGMEMGEGWGMLSVSGENSTWLSRALAKGVIDDRGS